MFDNNLPRVAPGSAAAGIRTLKYVENKTRPISVLMQIFRYAAVISSFFCILEVSLMAGTMDFA